MIRLIKQLPVQVALVALAVYLLTLSHGTTFASLPLTAKLAGWDWMPMTGHPLLWLLTLPLRLLPAGWVAPALNLFSALLAALVLGILVHSLELAAWTRPLESLGWRGRLPLLLAAAICGLEFNFWREATAATGEMLQLLLLAAAIGCLLRYRAEKRFQWLPIASAVGGAGMTENWMMVFTLPLFVVSVFWLARRRMVQLLSVKRIVYLALAGLAGFSIFFILPVADSFSAATPENPVVACGLAIKSFYHELGGLRYLFWQLHKMPTLAAILFFLIPVVSIFIRPQDDKLEQKSRLEAMILRVNRLGRTAFLLASVWLAFDPIAGPRQILLKQAGIAVPLLSFDYLMALAAGFLAGNLLLTLRGDPGKQLRSRNALKKFSRRAATPAFVGLLVVAVLGLLLRNTAAITLVNREPLTQLARLAVSSLPPGRGLMLGDDPSQMMVFQAAVAAAHKDRDWPVADARLLAQPAYRALLSKKYPGDWLTRPGQGVLTAKGTGVLIAQFVQTNQVYFLNDSYGPLFEACAPEPTGSIYALKLYTSKTIDPPALSPATIAATEKFWDETGPQIDDLQKILSPHEPVFTRALHRGLAILQLEPVASPQTRLLADWYSAALDGWGVSLQRAGQPAAARRRFTQALELNSRNTAARLNLFCNTNLAAGAKLNLAGVKLLHEQLSNPEAVKRFIDSSGPVDEPSFCYVLGVAFNQAGLPRQAIQQFRRSAELAPDIAAPKLELAQLYTRYGFADESRDVIEQARKLSSSPLEKSSLESSLKTGLDVLEAESWLSQTNVANANSVLQPLLQQHSDDAQTQALILRTYMAFGDYSNALDLVNGRLRADPANIGALVDKAAIYSRMGAASNAVTVLDSVLAITNTVNLQLLRADARVNAGQLAAAESDYRELDQVLTNHVPSFYGLSRIAFLRHNTNEAVALLERCLTNTTPGSQGYQLIDNQLRALRPVK